MSKVYKSKACAAIHETAEALYEHGIIDKTAMEEFDASCVVRTEQITCTEKKHHTLTCWPLRLHRIITNFAKNKLPMRSKSLFRGKP